MYNFLMAIDRKPFFYIVGGVSGLENVKALEKGASLLARTRNGQSSVYVPDWYTPQGVAAKVDQLEADFTPKVEEPDLTIMICMSGAGLLGLHLQERLAPEVKARTRLALVCARSTPNNPTSENDKYMTDSEDYSELVNSGPEVVLRLNDSVKRQIVTFASVGDLVAPPDTVAIPDVNNEVLRDPPLDHHRAMGMFFRYRSLMDQLIQSP
jgi:hypothetical protein